MSDTLDDKLDYILKSNAAVQVNFDEFSVNDYDKLIPAIKQAFTNEGYTKTNAQFYAAYAAEKKRLLRQGVMRVASNSVGQISDLAAKRAAGLDKGE